MHREEVSNQRARDTREILLSRNLQRTQTYDDLPTQLLHSTYRGISFAMRAEREQKRVQVG